MTYDFNTLIPGCVPYGKSKTLFTRNQSPLLLKKVDNFAQAVAAGGFIVYYVADGFYEFFLGDTARGVLAKNLWRQQMRIGIAHAPGDGDSAQAAYTGGGTLTRNGWFPSGVTESFAKLTGARGHNADEDIRVMAIVSNAAYGYGSNGILKSLIDADYTDRAPLMKSIPWHVLTTLSPGTSISASGGSLTPMHAAWNGTPDATTSLLISTYDVNYGTSSTYSAPKAIERGSVVIPVAMHKKSKVILSEQRAELVKNAGKAKQYVDRALDEYLSNPANPDEVLYLPLVVTWAENVAGKFDVIVGHWVQDDVGEPGQWDKMFRPLAPSTVPSGGSYAVPTMDVTALAEPLKTMAGSRGGNTTRPTNPVDINFTDSTWNIFRSFEGQAVLSQNVVFPNPFLSQDAVYTTGGLDSTKRGWQFCPGVIKVGKGQSASAYAGIDTAFACRGGMPALVINGDGTRPELNWGVVVSNADLLGSGAKPKMPERSRTVPSVGDSSSADELNNAYLALRANADLTVAAPRVINSWETYWSPVKRLETIIKAIYDRAYAIGEAEN